MSPGRAPFVVDTNVAVIANRRGGESYKCANACSKRLMGIRHSGTIVIDDEGRIIDEYKRYLRAAGQPGVGDAFFKWLIDHRYQQDLCRSVTIHADGNTFKEFPNGDDLAEFDLADHKFIAVAVAHGGGPTISQGSDAKWWGFKDVFRARGINVEFLCADEIEARYIQKFGE